LYERLGTGEGLQALDRTGELVLGTGRVAEALTATGGTAFSPAAATASEAIEALLRARAAGRLVVTGIPSVLELFAQPLRALNFVEASGTRTALVVGHEIETTGLLDQVQLFVTSPHLLDRVRNAEWLPRVASRQSLDVGAKL